MSEIKKEILEIQKKINSISGKDRISIMEVCGTHTMSIAKTGIRSLLPENIRLISGPGCPVCVTPAGAIQSAIDLADSKDFIVATFGDMLRIPGENGSLQDRRNVKIVYSPLDALDIAKANPDKETVFLGAGFETTIPLAAAAIMKARSMGLKNFSVFSMGKTVPAALKLILQDKDSSIDGLLLPGHVSVITGRKYFDFLSREQVPGVISGFKAVEIMTSILLLVKNIMEGTTPVLNNYKKVVSEEGNKEAQRILNEVFEAVDADWRGIGNIPSSGLGIRKNWKDFDVLTKYGLSLKNLPEPEGCLCGSILMGKALPSMCRYFGKKCTPLNPVGPCMVSSEGTCAAYYKYN